MLSIGVVAGEAKEDAANANQQINKIRHEANLIKEQIAPGTAHIRITSQAIKRDRKGKERISTSSLYNRMKYRHAIGNSVIRCIMISKRRTLPRGTRFCNGSFRFPLGQILVAGIVMSEIYYKLAIVGGTGVYNNIGGEVRVIATKLAPRKENLVFTIHAF